MIFMGEEWGASTPWQFFTSHPEPELAEKVATGRREEFAQMDWDLSQVPDPQDPATFERSKLDWDEADRARARRPARRSTERLIRIRRTLPRLLRPALRRRHRHLRRRRAAGCWSSAARSALLINFRGGEVRARTLDGACEELLTVGRSRLSEGSVWLAPQSAVAVLRR